MLMPSVPSRTEFSHINDVMLSQQALDEFKKLFFEQFGQQINDQKALELGTNLIKFYKIIYQSKEEKPYGNENRTTEQ